MKKPQRGSNCPRRPFDMAFLGHKWVKRFYDKFGTGKRDQVYYQCDYCLQARFDEQYL